MRLLLVRHAQTLWNVEHRVQGHADIELDEHGLAQSALLEEAIAAEGADLVWTSDLKRSAATATRIAARCGAPLELDRALRERCYGDWEGRLYTEVREELASLVPATSYEEVLPPAGESYQMVWDRLEPVASRLRQLDGTAVVVTHGGTCALLLARLLDAGIQAARAFRFSNASITELERRADGSFVLVRFNDISHLSEVASRVGALESSIR